MRAVVRPQCLAAVGEAAGAVVEIDPVGFTTETAIACYQIQVIVTAYIGERNGLRAVEPQCLAAVGESAGAVIDIGPVRLTTVIACYQIQITVTVYITKGDGLAVLLSPNAWPLSVKPAGGVVEIDPVGFTTVKLPATRSRSPSPSTSPRETVAVLVELPIPDRCR